MASRQIELLADLAAAVDTIATVVVARVVRTDETIAAVRKLGEIRAELEAMAAADTLPLETDRPSRRGARAGK